MAEATQGMPKALQQQEEQLGTAQTQDPAPANNQPTGESGQTEHSPQPASETQTPQNPGQQPQQPQQVQFTQGAQALGGNTAQATPGQSDDNDPNSDTWKQRYNVINGKYVNETGRLQRENEELKARLQQLETQQAPQPAQAQDGQSQTTPAQPQTQPASNIRAEDITEEEVKQEVTQEMIDEFGMDFWKNHLAVTRRQQAAAQPQGQSPADERLQEVESRLNEQSRQAFYDELTRLVPDWQTINESQEWNDFLAQYHPEVGVTYEALLMDAYRQFQSDRVANLFFRFKGQQNGSQAPSKESQVMPNSTNSSSVPANQGETMTYEQWEKEMAEIAKSTDPTSPEVQEKQKKLDAAFREGRVLGAPNAANQASPEASFV